MDSTRFFVIPIIYPEKKGKNTNINSIFANHVPPLDVWAENVYLLDVFLGGKKSDAKSLEDSQNERRLPR